MNKILMALLMGGLGLGLAHAQDTMTPEKKPEIKKEMKAEKKHEKKAKMNMCKGTVEAVDAAAGKITVKDSKGMVMTMPVGDEAKITKAGKPAALADIVVGEKVHLMYEGAMDNPMVKSVKVENPPVKKGKGMKKPVKAEEPKM